MQRCFLLVILLLSLCITACGETQTTATPTPTPATATPTPTPIPATTTEVIPTPTIPLCVQQTPAPEGPNTISGTVWNDTDNNGQWDNGEQPASDLSATIKLKDSNGRIVQTVIVDCSGGYAFHNLPDDTYSLSPSFHPTNKLQKITVPPDCYTANIGYNG